MSGYSKKKKHPKGLLAKQTSILGQRVSEILTPFSSDDSIQITNPSNYGLGSQRYRGKGLPFLRLRERLNEKTMAERTRETERKLP